MSVGKSDFTETGIWNIAKGYTEDLVHKALVEIYQLETIAKYGTYTIDQAFNFSHVEKTMARIQAVDRLLDKMQQLVTNTVFSVKDAKDKEQMLLFSTHIEDLTKYLGLLRKERIDTTTNQRSLTVNEVLMNEMIKKVRLIRADMTLILDKHGLIFYQAEQLDFDKLRKRLEEEG